MSRTLVLLRNDLRLSDNPALFYACKRGDAYVCYQSDSLETLGAASKWWLHQSLNALSKQIVELGGSLIIRESASEVLELCRALGVDQCVWNRRYSPSEVESDKLLKEALKAGGVETQSFASRVLIEPWLLKNKSNKVYQVFTPFSKAFMSYPRSLELCDPPQKIARACKIETREISDLDLLPKLDWASGFHEYFLPGERAALECMKNFKNSLSAYQNKRDYPSIAATSRLSVHLHFGEVSVHRLWKEFEASSKDSFPYLRQLIWRDFAHYCLFHFPTLLEKPLKREFERFAWREDKEHFKAWCQGKTGYPIVDAGMRELWHTGWMHNRVRMIVGSFLVKNLLIPWQWGMDWFWDTLLDADKANNSMGWQWVAGCGIDAAPYFRIFNPIVQSEKFDAQGDYIRKWVPELAKLPNKYLHKPFEMDSADLRAYGLELGKHYPKPIVDYKRSRQRALDAYAALRKGD